MSAAGFIEPGVEANASVRGNVPVEEFNDDEWLGGAGWLVGF